MKDPELGPLSDVFGRRLRFQVPLVRYTASRVGGPADVLLEVDSADELAQAAMILWKLEFPFVIIGGGSNVLVSDLGIREVVLINRARALRFDDASQPPSVWAESGANFGALARQAASHGLSGLEWAAGIPGTLGGAIVGNAGAHGGEVADNLLVAEILQQQTLMQDDVPQPQKWPAEKSGDFGGQFWGGLQRIVHLSEILISNGQLILPLLPGSRLKHLRKHWRQITCAIQLGEGGSKPLDIG